MGFQGQGSNQVLKISQIEQFVSEPPVKWRLSAGRQLAKRTDIPVLFLHTCLLRHGHIHMYRQLFLHVAGTGIESYFSRTGTARGSVPM